MEILSPIIITDFNVSKMMRKIKETFFKNKCYYGKTCIKKTL